MVQYRGFIRIYLLIDRIGMANRIACFQNGLFCITYNAGLIPACDSVIGALIEGLDQMIRSYARFCVNSVKK